MLTFENAPHDDRCAIAHECHKSGFIPHPVRASQKEKTDISISQNFLVWVAFLKTILYQNIFLCSRFLRNDYFSGTPNSEGSSM